MLAGRTGHHHMVSSLGPGISSGQMYAIEENGSSLLKMPKFLMMENAGHAAAGFLIQKFSGRLQRKKVVVVCGTGNNGGDGFVVSRHLASYGVKVSVLLLGSQDNISTEESLMNWTIIQRMDESIRILSAGNKLVDTITRADIVVDAIFGTGIKGEIAEPHASAIDAINRSKGYTLALDIPSGLDPNSGVPKKKVCYCRRHYYFSSAKGWIAKRTQVHRSSSIGANWNPPRG